MKLLVTHRWPSEWYLSTLYFVLILVSHIGAQVLTDAGREEGPREILETSDPADDFQPSQQRGPHHLHQRHQEERPVCAGARPARRSQ